MVVWTCINCGRMPEVHFPGDSCLKSKIYLVCSANVVHGESKRITEVVPDPPTNAEIPK